MPDYFEYKVTRGDMKQLIRALGSKIQYTHSEEPPCLEGVLVSVIDLEDALGKALDLNPIRRIFVWCD